MRAHGFATALAGLRPLARFAVFAVPVLIACAGCDTEIVSAERSLGRATASRSCTHPGFCMECGLDYRGKFDCMPRLRPACRGRQPGTAERIEQTWHWESEPDVKQTRIVNRDFRPTGACR